MYHSVAGPRSQSILGSYPIEFKFFKHQIQKLRTLGYSFGSLNQLREAAQSGDRVAFITSDDGTVDWCSNALPFLEAEGIPSHMGIISGVWEENPIYPLTHIIQIILKTRSQKELQVLAERLSIGLQDRDKKHIQDHYKYETDPVRQLIKGCFNLVLSAAEGIKKIGPISDEEKHYLEQRFVKANELRKFCHLTIGNHSKSHETLGLCAQTYFEKEVLSWEKIRKTAGLKTSNVFTLPITGKSGAPYQELALLLKSAGYEAMLTGNGVWNSLDFIVPRIDAIHFENWLSSSLVST